MLAIRTQIVRTEYLNTDSGFNVLNSNKNWYFLLEYEIEAREDRFNIFTA